LISGSLLLLDGAVIRKTATGVGLALLLAVPGRAQLYEFAVADAESTVLRIAPSGTARALRNAYPGEQFRIIGIGKHRLWYRVTTGIYRYDSASRAESSWVSSNQLHFESSQTSYATVSLDLSLLEVPEGNFSRRVGAGQFLEDPSSLPAAYYVAANYVPRGAPDYCAGPYSTCGDFYLPGRYFLLGRPEADSTRYDRLYNNGTVRPVYTVESALKIRDLRARLVITRGVYDRHDCYDSHFLGQEVRSLADTTYSVHDYETTAHFTLPSSVLWKPDRRGEAGWALVTLIIDMVPERFPGWTSRLVRSVSVSWPACY
jgi:hypothetical protein